MYSVLPVSRRLASTSRKEAVRVVRRRLATDLAPPRKKKNVVRKFLWVTAGATGTFYVGSTFAAFYSQTYYDFFADKVPLGQTMLEYAETHHWDTLTAEQVFESAKRFVSSSQQVIVRTYNRLIGDDEAVEEAVQEVEKRAREASETAANTLDAVVSSVKTEVRKERDEDSQEQIVAKYQAQQVTDELADLVRRAENALAGRPDLPFPASEPVSLSPTPISTKAVEPLSSTSNGNPIYEAPLPVGFEPPPGYSRPSGKKHEPTPAPAAAELSQTPVTLPLVAPVVSSLQTEPVLNHLAGSIDNLASFLASNPEAASKASDVLETAKSDLTTLAERIEKAKEEERAALETKLDEQAREYSIRLLDMEMQAQDKLDSQEEEFRRFFQEEKTRLVQAYREKLEQELKTQTELINERLKEEVIAQGIELQRRWIREIKVRVEQERGGRLAKIEELAANLKRLERIALDNSTYLDENIRVHALWSAIRAVSSSALSSPVRKPFREELRVLRHIAAAREDIVVSAALDSLEATQVPDVGVEPFADLASWFASDVAPKVSHVALVPDENAGVLSYLASRIFSGLQFRRQGLVSGDDVLSVLARAEYYLNEKDLDSAARELNQLKGPAKMLLHDWLEAARRRLEVEQALEVIQTQATLASLQVV